MDQEHRNTSELLGMELNGKVIMTSSVQRWPLPVPFVITWPSSPSVSWTFFIMIPAILD